MGRSVGEETEMGDASLSQYGGWTELKGKKTGFFHLEEIGNRWWFVDPDGYAYICLAVNHIMADTLREPYNEHVFVEKYGNTEAFHLNVGKDLRSWGFTALGTYNDDELQPRVNMPYFHLFRLLNICGYWGSWTFREEYAPLAYRYFPDIYSQAWLDECEEKIERGCARLCDDPLLIGYFFSDVPVWYQVDRWVDALRMRSGEAPGKTHYVQKMAERYGNDISQWNAVYGTAYRGFEDMMANPFRRISVNDRARVIQDDQAFVRQIARDYYRLVHDLIKSHDPNHLLLGDKYDGNAGIPPFVLEEAKPYIDTLCVQYYQIDSFTDHIARIDHWQKLVEKPVLDTDSSYAVPKLKMPNPYGPHCANQHERGLCHKRYAETFFRRPYGVGWLWCGYIDNLKGSGRPGTQEIHQHSGLKNEFDEPHADCTDLVTQTNRRIYAIASG
jgi:hypothetical protein